MRADSGCTMKPVMEQSDGMSVIRCLNSLVAILDWKALCVGHFAECHQLTADPPWWLGRKQHVNDPRMFQQPGLHSEHIQVS